MFSAGCAASILLVDGENLSPGLAGQIIHQVAQYGRPLVQRVYGDVARLTAWEEAAGFEMVHSGRAKNAADIRIVIDALDLVQRGGVDRVFLACSDRDFSHLGQYLRARGIEVIGMGEAKTHESFRAACSRFVELGVKDNPLAKAEIPKDIPPPDPAMAQIAALILGAGTSGLLVSELGCRMKSHGFVIGQHEKKNWRGYLSAYPQIYDLDPKGPQARVRLKRISPRK